MNWLLRDDDSKEVLEQQRERIIAKIETGLRYIRQHEDGPFTMTVLLKEIEELVEEFAWQALQSAQKTEQLRAFLGDLVDDYNEAVHDRDLMKGWLRSLSIELNQQRSKDKRG